VSRAYRGELRPKLRPTTASRPLAWRPTRTMWPTVNQRATGHAGYRDKRTARMRRRAIGVSRRGDAPARVNSLPMALPAADDRLLRQNASLLADLAARHGISSIQLGTYAAELVVTMEDGRTYLDLAEFEAEAEALLRHRVNVTSAGAPGALPRELLAPASAA